MLRAIARQHGTPAWTRQHGRTVAYNAAVLALCQSRQQHSNGPSSTAKGDPGLKAKPRRARRGRVAIVLLVSIIAGASARTLLDDGSLDSQKGLNTTTFSPFTLVKKEAVSSTSTIFTFKPDRPSSTDIRDLWSLGVWSIQIKQPQLQIARAYTPLPPTNSSSDDELRLLIRKEHNGEMSNYLHSLPAGTTVELRGPSIEHVLPPAVSEVIFLAGGTGIAPALQVAHAVRGTAKMSILWANRHREDCLGGKSDTQADTQDGWQSWLSAALRGSSTNLDTVKGAERDEEPRNAVVKQLDARKRLGDDDEATRLIVDYYVDDEKSFIQPANIIQLLAKNTAIDTASTTKLIVVSGPDGFVSYWAGPKQWANGKETQGQLSGVLSTLDLRGWNVVKL